ncbi:peptide deformylase [Sinanaerobacter sp. ZZT-01]|uniref:peptide deformylase n=1 Tax=Sinanaerobacter sp. ZZT-01 TaxID=3111540 RepID=UPI002D77FC52|nr:peptide deformylase [Sinanaerobacter sp. ZZT-01]WRR92778.1 peptide deformylase [Sinanaerobacter sp. ZZT-01]
MALRNVVCRGDEILGKKAREVKEINERILETLDDMLETMRESNGIGIAAPQVGILKQMFIVEVDGTFIELINPQILEMDGKQIDEEGCLSVPGVIGKVERPKHVKITGLNREGKTVVYDETDLVARALCHEYDHLQGILFVDKAFDVREIELDVEE